MSSDESMNWFYANTKWFAVSAAQGPQQGPHDSQYRGEGMIDALIARRAAATQQPQPLRQEVPLQVGPGVQWADATRRGPRYGDSLRIENAFIAARNQGKTINPDEWNRASGSQAANATLGVRGPLKKTNGIAGANSIFI